MCSVFDIPVYPLFYYQLISYEIRQKKKNGAADVQYHSELVSIFCADLSPPKLSLLCCCF